MSGPNHQYPVRAVLMPPPAAPDQRVAEAKAKESKRSYVSMVVAMVLAKARRDADCTDDITTAVANCHISNRPAGPANQTNPFRF